MLRCTYAKCSWWHSEMIANLGLVVGKKWVAGYDFLADTRVSGSLSLATIRMPVEEMHLCVFIRDIYSMIMNIHTQQGGNTVRNSVSSLRSYFNPAEREAVQLKWPNISQHSLAPVVQKSMRRFIRETRGTPTVLVGLHLELRKTFLLVCGSPCKRWRITHVSQHWHVRHGANRSQFI